MKMGMAERKNLSEGQNITETLRDRESDSGDWNCGNEDEEVWKEGRTHSAQPEERSHGNGSGCIPWGQ